MGLLSDLQVKAAQPRDKEFMLSDGEGLYLRVRSNGKVWLFRYQKNGKPGKLSLGSYPAVSLAAARKKARAEADKLTQGIDPEEIRRQEQERARVAQLNTLERTARAWHAQAKKDRHWSDGYAEKVIRHLELHIFPWLGDRELNKVLPTELVHCLHRIKDRGHLETAQRVREAVRQVFQYAVDIGALEPAKNFVNRRTGGLPPPRARHFAAITDPYRLAQLLRDIQGYKGHVLTRAALRLMPMLFQRPGQLRFAHWEDISFQHEIWRCPPEKMKLREWQKRDSRTPAHLVPVPRQGMEILQEIYPLTGPTGPIFRNMAKRSEASRYMSDNTINSALRTLGYSTQEDITGHGFRATARTLIRELLHWDADVIERHLAHVSDEELGGSYDRATFLSQRRKMVQQWRQQWSDGTDRGDSTVNPDWDNMCHNSPHREYNYTIIEELVRGYKPQAMWLDRFDWSGNLPGRFACTCPYCTRKFESKTGHAMPRAADWDSEAWRSFVKWRSEVLTQYFAEAKANIKAIDPGVDVCLNTHNGLDMFGTWFHGQDVESLTREADHVTQEIHYEREGYLGHSLIPRFTRAASGGRPVEALSFRHTGQVDFALKPQVHMYAEAGALMANGCAPMWDDMVYPQGVTEPAVYEQLKNVFDFTSDRQPWLNGKPVKWAGVYFSKTARTLYGREDAGGDTSWNSWVRAAPCSKPTCNSRF